MRLFGPCLNLPTSFAFALVMLADIAKNVAVIFVISIALNNIVFICLLSVLPAIFGLLELSTVVLAALRKPITPGGLRDHVIMRSVGLGYSLVTILTILVMLLIQQSHKLHQLWSLIAVILVYEGVFNLAWTIQLDRLAEELSHDLHHGRPVRNARDELSVTLLG